MSAKPVDLRTAPIGTFAKGAGSNLVGRVIGQFFQMVAHVTVARLYGPVGFGLFGLAWTIFRLGSFFAPLGLEAGVVRYGSRCLIAQSGAVWATARRATNLTLLTSSALGILLFVMASSLAAIFGEQNLGPVIRIFAVGLPIAALMRVGVAVTRVSQQMKFAVRSEYLLQPLSFLVLVIAFHTLGGGVQGAAWAAVGSFGIAATLAWFYSRQLFRPRVATTLPQIVGRLELLSFSVPVALAGFAGIAVIWVDRIILAYFVTAGELGLYQAASQVALLFAVIPTATSAVMSPLVSDLHTRGRIEELNEIFRSSIRWSLYVTIPVVLVIFMVPAAALETLFGAAYTTGSPALVVLSVGQLVSVITGTSGFVLAMTGHQRQWLWVSGTALVFNVLLNWLLIPRFGLLGAAAATSLSLGVMYVPAVFLLRNLLGLWPYSRGIIHLLIPSIITILALWIANTIVEWGAVATLTLNAAVSVSVFATSILLLGAPPEDRLFIRLLISQAGPRAGTVA